MADEMTKICLDGLKAAAARGRSEYLKSLVDGMKVYRAAYRNGMCYAAVVVERETGTNIAIIKHAVNGYVKKVMELPFEVAPEYARVFAEAVKEYEEKHAGGEGGGEEAR